MKKYRVTLTVDEREVLIQMIAGGLGGSLKTGHLLDYLHAGNDKRKLCSLYLALMDRMGLTLPEFGDSKERLAGI